MPAQARMAFPATVACVFLHALASIRRKPCTCVYHRRGRCPHRPVQGLPNLYHFKGAYSGRLIASPTFLTSFPPYRSTLQHLKLDVLCRLSSKCLPLTREVGEARRERKRTEMLLNVRKFASSCSFFSSSVASRQIAVTSLCLPSSEGAAKANCIQK